MNSMSSFEDTGDAILAFGNLLLSQKQSNLEFQLSTDELKPMPRRLHQHQVVNVKLLYESVCNHMAHFTWACDHLQTCASQA